MIGVPWKTALTREATHYFHPHPHRPHCRRHCPAVSSPRTPPAARPVLVTVADEAAGGGVGGDGGGGAIDCIRVVAHDIVLAPSLVSPPRLGRPRLVRRPSHPSSLLIVLVVLIASIA